MKKFNRIAIVGVGLIGGSLGLAIKKNKIAKKVVGICRRKVSLKAAVKSGACDIVTLNYKKGLKGADFVIIATPVGRIVNIAKKVIKHVKSNVILTDVGSTKEIIVNRIEKIVPSHVKFVGSHPMAGSEKSGVKFAQHDLFKDSVCIVTKSKKTNKKALNTVKKFWKTIGTTSKVLSPANHDRYISFVSHLPHVAAIALTVAAESGSLEYASTGFRDTTRIASSDPLLWQDIFMTNRKSIIKSISKYKKILREIEISIKGKNKKFLRSILKKSKDIRDRLE